MLASGSYPLIPVPFFLMLILNFRGFSVSIAYENPVFVEDVVRSAQKLKCDKKIKWFQVESENWKSIHNHNAYAMVREIGR